MKKSTPSVSQSWVGNIDDLSRKAGDVLAKAGIDQSSNMSIRLLRDYISRGILGPVRRSGKELSFDYVNLLRLVAARVLLNDGWSLGKIAEHLESCQRADLEQFLPAVEAGAMAALRRIREEGGAVQVAPASLHLRRAASSSPLRMNARLELRRAGLPESGPEPEAVTLIAVTPWLRVLVTTDRIPGISPQDADAIGRSIAASLVGLARRKKENRK